MQLDKITEAIAHFIGLFDITLEQARLRKAYEEFKALQRQDEEVPDLPQTRVKIDHFHEFAGFDPYVKYIPAQPDLPWTTPYSQIDFVPPEIPDVLQLIGAYPRYLAPHTAPGSSGGVVPSLQPPGSVAVYINQNIRLFDDDNSAIGGHGLAFNPSANNADQVAALFEAAARLSPLSAVERPGSAEEIKTFITTSAETLRAFSGEPAAANEQPVGNSDVVTDDGSLPTSSSSANADIFFLKARSIEGNYVDGKSVNELPLLDDHLISDLEEPDAEARANDSIQKGGRDGGESSKSGSSATGELVHEQTDGLAKASVVVEAGDNTLINSVSLTSNWLSATVMATLGDHIELNAVIQINAWSDQDLLSSGIANWTVAGDPTQAYNIARFHRTDPAAETGDAGDDVENMFPGSWAVAEITGDLIIMNWLEQFSFMMDNDTAILSSSGVNTLVTAGGNTAVNDIWLQQLGYGYDLIVVGGSIFDANIIHQMNVLFDNDLVGAVNGFETTGKGEVATAGNLIWNQATIVNIGGANRFEALPDHYRQAAESLNEGNKILPDSVLNDPMFAGLEGLRVLYISGDFINLNYVKQTNVLGDNDQIALAMNALSAHPEADWAVTAGANTLVNFAGVMDVDSSGKTYVGGGQYSDEILFQAELISSDPKLGAQDPDQLVNEAVAFLGDDMLTPDNLQPANHIPIAPDATSADPMQTILA